MLKEIWKDSMANLKKNWFQSFVLCMIAVAFFIVTGAMLAIPYLQFLGFLFGLFVAAPMLFSIMVSHYGLRKDVNSFSWGNIWKYFVAYYKMPFRGAFRVMMSIFYMLLYILLFQYLFTLGALSITQSVFPEFAQSIKELVDTVTANGVLTEADLVPFLEENEQAINLLSYILGGFSILGFSLVASYSLYNAFRTYYLIEFPTDNVMYANAGYHYGLLAARGNLLKGYWAYNWPLFLLIIGGYIIGTTIFYTQGMVFGYGYACSFMLAFAFGGLYLPFFFSNSESIFKYNIKAFDPKSNNSTQAMIDQLQTQIKQYGAMMNDLERKQKDYQNMRDEEKRNETNDTVVSNQDGTGQDQDHKE